MARRGTAKPSSWMGGSVVAWVAMGITLIANAITIGAVFGSVMTRINQVETKLENIEKRYEVSIAKMETKIDGINVLAVDMASVKAQLVGIGNTLSRMEGSLKK